MRCEVVAIGTELLLGQIIDTNSSWIGEQLAMAGIDSHFQTKVGDNLARIIDSIQLALSRSDAVICCGGLGPTQDDITREEQQLLRDLANGTLLQNRNNAVARFGHGTLRMPGRSILIGASTGGRTREVLDNWQPYNIDKWMRAELGWPPGLD